MYLQLAVNVLQLAARHRVSLPRLASLAAIVAKGAPGLDLAEIADAVWATSAARSVIRSHPTDHACSPHPHTTTLCQMAVSPVLRLDLPSCRTSICVDAIWFWSAF